MQPHGDTANDPWDLVEDGPGRLVVEINSKNPKCRVTKTLSIKEGQRAVYQPGVAAQPRVQTRHLTRVRSRAARRRPPSG